MKTLLIAVASLALGTAAQAEPIYVNGAPRVARVSVADLNLNTAVGRGIAHRRIRAAAEQVCSTDRTRELIDGIAARYCATAAVNDGYRQLSGIIAHLVDGNALAQVAIGAL